MTRPEHSDATLARDVITPDEVWRNRMISFASESESEITALRPEETGLPMTIHISERSDYPTLIVDSQPGHHFAPSADSRAFAIGERTGVAEIDQWIQMNVEALQDYVMQRIDTVDLYKRLRKI